MPLEIERKFLVTGDAWRMSVSARHEIRQGYFARTPSLSARIRLMDGKAFITLKGQPGALVRSEYEYPVPYSDAVEMIDQFSMEPPVEKTRYCIAGDGPIWSVDVFHGLNTGLVLAEVELERPDQQLARPAWIGQEVTQDQRYANSNLSRRPFSTWETSREPGI